MIASLTRHMVAALALVLLSPASASAVGFGKFCGDFPGIQCDGGLFCQYVTGRCGVRAPGTCVKVPAGCPKNLKPVCGCDNKTYSNDCFRQMARVSKKHNGQCK